MEFSGPDQVFVKRNLDPSSTGETYRYGLNFRVLPALEYLPVTQFTVGVIDRTSDAWEKRYGASTIKNSIAPLARVPDEAVRGGSPHGRSVGGLRGGLGHSRRVREGELGTVR
jgi:hypothetical protein